MSDPRAERITVSSSWHASEVTVATLIFAEDLTLTHVSPSVRELLGYTPEDLLALWPKIVQEDERDVVLHLLRSVPTDGSGESHLTVRVRHADESIHIVRVDALHVAALRATIVTMIDVCERPRPEQPHTDHLSFTDPTVMMIVDTDEHITHWSAAAEQFFGWTAAEAVGKRILEITQSDVLTSSFDTALQLMPDGAHHANRAYVTSTGDTILTRIIVSPLTAGDGDPIMNVIAIARAEWEGHDLPRQWRTLRVDEIADLSDGPGMFQQLQVMLATRHDHPTSIGTMHLDVQGFADIIRRFGREQGNALLREVIARIHVVTPIDTTVARTGEDEFAIAFTAPTIEITDTARCIADRVRSALALPFDLGSEQVITTTSIGIAFSIDGKLDADSLIRHAHQAFLEASAAGRGEIRIHDAHRTASTVSRAAQLQQDIRRALTRNELRLHFQPIVDMRTGRAVGAEALVRWEHPVMGLLPPSSFLGDITELGLHEPLARWVINEAARQLAAYDLIARTRPETAFSLPVDAPFGIGLNVSAHQVTNPNLVGMVQEAAATHGLSIGRFTLEFTEDALVRDLHGATLVLNRLREIGVHLYLDDFGSGYSSLGYLNELPVHGIKLDRSFLRDLGERPGSLTIVEAMIQLARNLNVHIIAEGIEHPEHVGFLREHGCEGGQGFYFMAPTPHLVDCARIFWQHDLATEAS